MRNLRYIIYALLGLLPFLCKAQAGADSTKMKKAPKHYSKAKLDSLDKANKWAKYYLELDTSDKIAVHGNGAPKGVVLKTSVISWLENPASARLAVEIPVSQYRSFQAEAGYIYNCTIDGARLDKTKPNFELRLSGRYYIPERLVDGIYAEPFIGYRSFSTERGRWIGTPNPGRSDSTFYLDYTHPTKYQQTDYTAGIVAGIQPIVWKRLLIDLGIGLVFDLEHDKGTPDPATDAYVNTTKFLPKGQFAVRLGYVLGK
jgi:hypothetical protein